MLKRVFDFVASLLGLITLSPILLFLALWIKIDSTGPVFFRQERVGRHGKIFRIHKFRSMATNTEKESRLTIGQDKRITQVGQFIRHYKLDELPQLIDVLQGTMSLVGPRPEVAEFMDLYPHETRTKILSVKPGITDWAAIKMIDENEVLSKYPDPRQAYIDVIMPMKADYYLQYVAKHSVSEDIRIILATILKIIKRD
jgi:lipopolysaccharide/colanic/teichoic acid biosynthesis glycosyltransferase